MDSLKGHRRRFTVPQAASIQVKFSKDFLYTMKPVFHYAVFRSCSFPRAALTGFRCSASWKHRQDEQK
jgi:hypothetical protein